MKILKNTLLLLILVSSSSALANSGTGKNLFDRILEEECSAVPRDVVMRVITHESKSVYKGKVQPWPWTLNIDGQGYYFESYRLALLAAIKARKEGARRLGLGFGQIEWQYHSGRFSGLAEALKPRENIRAVCEILREAWSSKRVNSWNDAIAYYHRPVLDDISREYAKKVLAL